MTGYRSAFVAGDEDVIGAYGAYRPSSGTTPQEFVQLASVAAWEDEAHVERARARYGRKRDLFLDVLARKGLTVTGSAATMFLWVTVPGGATSEAFAERLLEAGIVVTPGAYLGAAGEGYVRIALVPTEEECAHAAAILEQVL